MEPFHLLPPDGDDIDAKEAAERRKDRGSFFAPNARIDTHREREREKKKHAHRHRRLVIRALRARVPIAIDNHHALGFNARAAHIRADAHAREPVSEVYQTVRVLHAAIGVRVAVLVVVFFVGTTDADAETKRVDADAALLVSPDGDVFGNSVRARVRV